MAGKLSIVGVGPGDPGLVTVKAARVLQTARYVFVPVAAAGKNSLAHEIAKQYIPPGTDVVELLFPMVRDRDQVQSHYFRNYEIIESVVRKGHDAAFLTIGDPCTYSTSWPLFTLFEGKAPDIQVEVVSGISSYADGAARAAENLAEGDEILSIVSAYDSLERINRVIDISDTVVFLKTYKERTRLLELIRKRDLMRQCIYIKRCGLEGQEIIDDLGNMPDDPDYLSMIILKKKKNTA